MVLYFMSAHSNSLWLGVMLTYNCKFQFQLEKCQGLNLSPLYLTIVNVCFLIQDEALLASWKQQLDRDVETLKIKGNLHNLRSVSSC